MNFIESVTVEGFWGDRHINLDFHEDVNFIIGINGSGKTTAVNLIVSALTADFIALVRIDFSKLIIKLRSSKNKKKPSIIVTKDNSSKNPFSSIEYAIQAAASEKPKKFDLGDYEEQMLVRRYPRHYPRKYRNRDIFLNETRGITELLDNLIAVVGYTNTPAGFGTSHAFAMVYNRISGDMYQTRAGPGEIMQGGKLFGHLTAQATVREDGSKDMKVHTMQYVAVSNISFSGMMNQMNIFARSMNAKITVYGGFSNNSNSYAFSFLRGMITYNLSPVSGIWAPGWDDKVCEGC